MPPINRPGNIIIEVDIKAKKVLPVDNSTAIPAIMPKIVNIKVAVIPAESTPRYSPDIIFKFSVAPEAVAVALILSLKLLSTPTGLKSFRGDVVPS